MTAPTNFAPPTPLPPSLRPLRPHQQTALDGLRSSLCTGHRRPMLMAPTGYGKCLGLGTPVIRYDGRVVAVEDIRAGDQLLGPDSLPRTVLSTCRSHGQLFRIVPKRGDPWVCNDVHVLTLVRTTTGAVIDVPLDQWFERSATFKHEHKLFSPQFGVDFELGSDPDIDPYFLGVWLGDGAKRLNCVAVTKPDAEIEFACEKVAAEHGLRVRVDGPEWGKCRTYHLARERVPGQRHIENELLSKLRRLFADGTFPHEVRTASRLFRQEFLAGVIDTDGHVFNGCVDIVQRNRSFADGIAFVARSLGLRVTDGDKVVGGVVYRRMTISGDFSGVETRIPRKRIAPRAQIKVATRSGFSVESIGEGPYAGFELDGDGRFLLGDFTVTHNTVLAAHIVSGALAKRKRITFCVPSLSLIDQTFERFRENGIDPVAMGVIQGDHTWKRLHAPVQIASVQTLARRSLPESDVVVIDEAHVRFKLYETWMADEAWQKVPFIGMSATPWSRGLGKLFDDLIRPTSVSELIAKGFLSPFRVFAPSHPDLDGVKTVAGDYHEGQLADRMCNSQLIADAVTTWLAKAEGRPTLCFAVNRAHAAQLADQFTSAGVSTAYVDGNTPREERDEIGRKLAANAVQVVVNIGCLTTGVDWDVRCISLCRPTKSDILFSQIIGRGLRTAPGKTDCLILDHSDTHLRLGMVTDIDHDELDDGQETAKAKRKERERTVPLPSECQQCAGLVPAGCRECPCCGAVHKRPTGVEQADGELSEFIGRSSKRVRGVPAADVLRTMDQRKVYLELLGFADERGRSKGWAAYAFRDVFGNWPSRTWSVYDPLEPSSLVRAFIRAKDIRWAKSKAAEARMEVTHAG